MLPRKPITHFSNFVKSAFNSASSSSSLAWFGEQAIQQERVGGQGNRINSISREHFNYLLLPYNGMYTHTIIIIIIWLSKESVTYRPTDRVPRPKTNNHLINYSQHGGGRLKIAAAAAESTRTLWATFETLDGTEGREAPEVAAAAVASPSCNNMEQEQANWSVFNLIYNVCTNEYERTNGRARVDGVSSRTQHAKLGAGINYCEYYHWQPCTEVHCSAQPG